jgi:FixJ family two-component response regulator
LVIAGLLNKEIGAELGFALRTIKTHRTYRCAGIHLWDLRAVTTASAALYLAFGKIHYWTNVQ